MCPSKIKHTAQERRPDRIALDVRSAMGGDRSPERLTSGSRGMKRLVPTLKVWHRRMLNAQQDEAARLTIDWERMNGPGRQATRT